MENIRNFISKIRAKNQDINAVLHLNENAIEQAREIDKKIKKRKAGKLAGIGVIIKSNFDPATSCQIVGISLILYLFFFN